MIKLIAWPRSAGPPSLRSCCANIPHIDIRDGDGREVKTDSAERKIPLVGYALEAMRRHPNGFPQFHDKIGPVRRKINNCLRALPPDINEDDGGIRKTLHCLRHTFKNRLRKTSASEEEIDAIIGYASCLVA